MADAAFIIYDHFGVVLGFVRGAAGVSAEHASAARVSCVPDEFKTGKYIWDAENEGYILNPAYEEQTALGKIYRANIGWVYPDYVPDEKANLGGIL